jgi:hypothetical protein
LRRIIDQPVKRPEQAVSLLPDEDREHHQAISGLQMQCFIQPEIGRQSSQKNYTQKIIKQNRLAEIPEDKP